MEVIPEATIIAGSSGMSEDVGHAQGEAVGMYVALDGTSIARGTSTR